MTEAESALVRMNAAPTVTHRADGYVQDESSQWVAAGVEAAPGERRLRHVRGTGRQVDRDGVGRRARDRR